MENEQKKIELANLMTYDEFVAIELFNLQDKNFILKIDKEKNVIIIEYCANFSYECNNNSMLIVQDIADVNVRGMTKNNPGNCYYVVNFHDIKRRFLNINSLLERTPYEIPPNLCEIKRKIDNNLKDMCAKESTILDGDEREFETAQSICEKYEYYHVLYNDEVFYYYMAYNKAAICVIDGIDKYRGCRYEQSILEEVIRVRAKCGIKIILKLWDLDSGFECLSSNLHDLIIDGKVELQLSNIMKIGLSCRC